MRRLVATGLLGAWTMLAGAAPVRAQEAQPLVLNGSESVGYAAPNGMDASSDGTIEVWAAALWEDDPGDAPCLLASRRSEKETHFSLHVSGARDEVALWNGSEWARAPFDFSDGRYHRIVATTRGPGKEEKFDAQGRMRRTRTDPRTEIRVDGQSLATLPVGYGGADGLPFHVGSCDGGSGFFTGAIYALRVWNEALPDEALEALSQVFGHPGEDHPYIAHLIAVTEPSADGPALWLASGAAPMAGAHGGTDGEGPGAQGDAHVPVRPEPEPRAGPDTGGVWVVRNSRRFEKDRLEGVPDAEHDKYGVYPVYVLEAGESEEVELSSETVGGGRGRAFRDQVPEDGRVAELRLASQGEGVDSLQLVVEAPGGATRELAVHGARGSGRVLSVELPPGEEVIGLSGTRGDRIHSLRVHTTERASERVGDPEKGEPFELWVPHGATLSGISGRALRHLGALALHYRTRAEALVLIGDDGTRRDFLPAGPDAYADGDSVLRFAAEDRFELDGRIFERVPPYLENEERGSYGDLYTVGSQLYNAEFSFRSFDITQLDPWDFKQRGARGYVFAYPTETSTEWYVRNKAVVPHGMEFLAQDRGGTTSSTTTHSEESSFQERLTRSISLGQGGLVAGRAVGAATVASAAASVGRKIPTKALFKWNESYTNAVRDMYEEEKTYTFGDARIAAYTLVLDKARVKLDERFRRRVEELLETRDYAGFIESYGTHYPYSITYGGLGIHQMEIDRSTYSRMTQQQVRIDMDAMGTILGKVTQGETPQFSDFFSTDQSIDEESKRKLESQLDNFRWIGGAGGFSKETWNVNEKQTPIYLDLRFIDELLAPPHFTDPVVTGELRAGLSRAVDAYLEDVPPVRTDSVRPKLFEVVVDSARCLNSNEVDRQVELTGSIEVRAFSSGRKEKEGTTGPLVWKRSGGADDYTTIKTGSGHSFNKDRRPDESPRHVFAVSEDELKSGYVQIEAQLFEYDPKGEQRLNMLSGGDEVSVPMGRKKTGRLYFRSMRPGLSDGGTLEFKQAGCTRGCAEVQVTYRYGRLD